MNTNSRFAAILPVTAAMSVSSPTPLVSCMLAGCCSHSCVQSLLFRLRKAGASAQRRHIPAPSQHEPAASPDHLYRVAEAWPELQAPRAAL